MMCRKRQKTQLGLFNASTHRQNNNKVDKKTLETKKPPFYCIKYTVKKDTPNLLNKNEATDYKQYY